MFPAYSNSNAVEKEDGELDDGEKYTSFDQAKILEARARKEAIAKANRLIERAKNENVVRYIYSDDSEDEGAQVHVAMPPIPHLVPYSEPKVVLPHPGKKKSKTSKRRNKKKKRAKRHHRSRSSSSSSGSEEKDGTRSSSSASSSDSDNNRRRRKLRKSSGVLANKEKWGFLLPGQERSAEGSYIVFHKHYDHEIFLMDSLPKGHTTEYRNRFYSVLNGSERLDKIFFPKEYVEHRTKDRSDRYYGGGLRNLNDAGAERIFRKKEPLYVSKADYIPLSQVKLQEFQFLHEVAEKKAASRERQERELEISRTMASELVPLEMKRFDCAKKFADDPRNPDNLDEFLKVNEEMFNANRARGSTGDRKVLVERQLSIIDKAISCNPRSADLRIKRLQYLKEIRPAGELLVEWEKMLNAFVNNCSVWENYLDHIQYDMALYKHDLLEGAFDRCFSKLTAILNGSFRSHKPEENTNVFLLQTYVRRLMWWMERGFTNRAIASVQATIEYHSQRPPALAMVPEPKRMDAFAQFWSSGVPRFGDRDAKGWNCFYERREVVDERQNPEIIERELQTQHITALENRDPRGGEVSEDGIISKQADTLDARARSRMHSMLSKGFA